MSNDLIVPKAKLRDPLAVRRNAPQQEFSRMDVVQNVQGAFEIIGGVNRLALWANQEPGKFFTQVYAKLMPSTSLNIQGDNTTIEIVHALPPTELDNHS